MSIVIMSIAIVLLVLCDQLSKIWAVSQLGAGQDIILWENVFHLHYLENTGAAWGIFSGRQTLLIVLTSIIIIGMIIYLFKIPKSSYQIGYQLALVLIISGAIGNLIDRIFLGYVRDFLYFKWINFPVFNVADMFVVIGVILLMFVILIFDKSSLEKEASK